MGQPTEVGDGEINASAPIILAGEVEVTADLDIVWDLVAGIDSWPSWNPEVKSASLEGELTPGTAFRWTAGRTRLVSRLIHVDAPHRIAWTGRAMGLRVVHVYRLQPRGGGTFVRTDESVEGVIARLFRRPIKARMGTAVAIGLRGLKTAAERRAGACRPAPSSHGSPSP